MSGGNPLFTKKFVQALSAVGMVSVCEQEVTLGVSRSMQSFGIGSPAFSSRHAAGGGGLDVWRASHARANLFTPTDGRPGTSAGIVTTKPSVEVPPLISVPLPNAADDSASEDFSPVHAVPFSNRELAAPAAPPSVKPSAIDSPLLLKYDYSPSLPPIAFSPVQRATCLCDDNPHCNDRVVCLSGAARCYRSTPPRSCLRRGAWGRAAPLRELSDAWLVVRVHISPTMLCLLRPHRVVCGCSSHAVLRVLASTIQGSTHHFHQPEQA